jgi:uncharacterized membrane-anchored protein YitT (DUF2179 family)
MGARSTDKHIVFCGKPEFASTSLVIVKVEQLPSPQPDGGEMNYGRIALATVGGMVAYFAAGFAIIGLVPQMIDEGRKYSAVFRPRESMMAVMPALMVATLVAILVLAVLYAMLYRGGYGLAEGVRFGALIGVFVICAFVVHNYVNLNIGLTLMLMQAVAYFIEWTAVGTVIGLLYRSSV